MNRQPDVTMAECEAALDHIAAAPKDGAAIRQLCVRPDFGARAFPSEIELSREQGIAGDRWPKHPWLRLANGDPDPRIQVSVLSKRVMDLCWRNRVEMPHPGDLLVVDMELSEANLPVGTVLQAGQAKIEVSDKFNTACVKWRRRYGDDSFRWINLEKNRPLRLRGVLCRVVQDGLVRTGDRLCKDAVP
ncbi:MULTISPECIES: hypothetical protein [unclassified Sulfitobacter]|uniref:MOSC domain-containing protein n=1 Tax=unclassified Sulfitobacter TaxID=196795 RepID=UPI0023E23B72|nr:MULTISPECIES: hypothetical protein [unclassified Sulfitobacter]